MTGNGRRVGRLVLALTIVSLAACGLQVRNYGYAPTDSELNDIVVGLDTRETVAGVIGPPRAAGILTDGGWYYVSHSYRDRGILAPEELDRQVVAISFDDRGVVENIERFGLERGQAVVLSRRVTDSNIKGIGFLRQLLGNFGRVSAEQLVDN